MQKEYFGVGCVSKLKEVITNKGCKKVFLVSDKVSFALSGAEEKIMPLLADNYVVHFNDFSPNPKLEDVQKGIDLYSKENCDLVIAVGGGSVIDMAKCINVLAAQSGQPQEYILKEKGLECSGNPLIAIPTTCGTGSEATHFAVVYIGNTKYSLAHKEYLIPDTVILDPTFVSSLPAKIAAATGMDALCQAIESYWAVGATDESKQYAKQAIILCQSNLVNAVNNNLESRAAMMRAANLAGKAINISKTTACHAISYPLTSYYNIPHGHAVALTLGEVFMFNSLSNDLNAKNVMQELLSILDVSSADGAKGKINTLMDAIGLQRKISLLGVNSTKDINVILENGFTPERMGNNPRLLSREDLNKILLDIM
jgi:alcohol dehydrogenase